MNEQNVQLNHPPNKYRHPHHEYGVKSHVSNRERLSPVKGPLANAKEMALKDVDIAELNASVGLPLDTHKIALLKILNAPPVKGIPLTSKTKHEYIEANTLFITSDESAVTETAFAYQNSGRAVTKREGWIASNGQVLTHHNIKGVGKTKSVDKVRIQKEQVPESSIGISRDVATDIQGTNRARKAGILTPILFPPIRYDEVIHLGKPFPANKYFNGETLYCIQRGWSSDIRLSALYRGVDSSYLEPEDLVLMKKNTQLTRNVFKSRVNRFLLDAQKVDVFNKEQGTQFTLGCGKYLKGDYSYASYSSAFREQMAQNIRAMIMGNI